MPQRLAAPSHEFDALHSLRDQVFSRTSDAPLIRGNGVRVLRDAAENYPAWERAINEACVSIHVEMYIVHCDSIGRWFIDLLAAKARQGVKVRFIYDWFGSLYASIFGLFGPLVDAGGEVRPFNPPGLTAVLGWTRRNHRKLIVVDGRVAFVSGLCVGEMWAGRPDRGQPPWRDTGVELTGPAVAHAEHAFAESWRLAGGQIEDADVPGSDDRTPPAGPVSLRLIPTAPYTASMLRLDLLVTALARRTLWITDAYFIGHGPFGEALRRAARAGVDVRLLLPQGSDVGFSVSASRTLYRTLLEAGVRIFEWNGSMVHAKTAVADGRWARVGSTNLNVISWLGNWELDVAIEDDGVAGTLAAHFEQDLLKSTEIVLTNGRPRVRTARVSTTRTRARRSARRVVRTVTGLGRSLGAAVTGSRHLEGFEFAPLLGLGLVLAFVAGITFWYPAVLAWPIAALAGWTGVTFVIEGVRLWRRGRKP